MPDNNKYLQVATVAELANAIGASSVTADALGDELIGLSRYSPKGAHSDGRTIASAQTLTPPSGATALIIQALTQNVRVTLDGTVPTATAGFQLRAGDPPVLIPIGTGTVIQVIQETATADLQYQFVGS